MRELIISLIVGLQLFSAARAVSGQDPSDAKRDSRAEVGRILRDYRKQRGDAARRTALTLELASHGEEALAGLGRAIDAELKAFARGLSQVPPDPQRDQQIARLQQGLERLRQDPQLTAEKIRQQGQPALQQLKLLVAAQQRSRQQLLAITKRLGPNLVALRDSCQELQQAWEADQGPQLPVQAYLEELDRLAKLSEPTQLEQRAEEVARANAGLAGRLPAEVLRGVAAANQTRLLCGLPPLEIDPRLCQAAWGHSDDMRRLGFFSHESPVAGKRTFAERARQAETTASGENIYRGSPQGATAVEAWFFSPGHHKIMLGAHRRVGLGNSGGHWTMLVGK